MSDKPGAGQIDLFVESLIDVPVKDDIRLLEYPWFSLQKHGRTGEFRFETTLKNGNRIDIQIKPGGFGMATIFDKDFLLYCQTLLTDRLNRGLPVSQTFAVNIYDFMRVTGRSTSSDGYKLVLGMLDRLKTTSIITNIKAGEEELRHFSWIDDFRVVTKTVNGKKRMTHVEITINRWTYQALVKDRRILTVNRAYFALEKGLERRLYELARKHLGNQQVWPIGLQKLAERVGTSNNLRGFKRDLREIAEADTLPDYRFEIVEGGEKISRFCPPAPAPSGDGVPGLTRKRRPRAGQAVVVFMHKGHEVIPPDTDGAPGEQFLFDALDVDE